MRSCASKGSIFPSSHHNLRNVMIKDLLLWLHASLVPPRTQTKIELRVTESWAGPRNEANCMHEQFKCTEMLLRVGENFCIP